MKFVIKSLLFVNLLLQLTSSLRRCFDHDQNLMLTIILLAFSLIGLIGLTIGNRFILIIFAACMTLMLIASITIYAIGRSEKDSMKPKVPYYVNVPQGDQDSSDPSKQMRTGGDPNKLKSLVSKLLNRSQKNPGTTEPIKGKRLRNNSTYNRTTRIGSNNIYDASLMRRTMASGKKQISGPALPPSPPFDVPQTNDDNSSSPVLMLVPPTSLVEDYSDTEAQPQLLAADIRPVARGVSGSSSGVSARDSPEVKAKSSVSDNSRLAPIDQDTLDDGAELGNQVRSEQWVAYERYLYEKYLNIVSQSIDLIMHTILASWMALLLDDDADQCFGGKQASSALSSANKSQLQIHGTDYKEAPVYNYNGVRYSIRPDGCDDSPPARVVAR